MYLTIGLVMMFLFAIAWVVAYITIKSKIFDYLKKNEIFYRNVTRTYYDYRKGERINEQGVDDKRVPGVMISSSILLFMCLFIYPLILGVLAGLFVYIQYLAENDKYEKIKNILNE